MTDAFGAKSFVERIVIQPGAKGVIAEHIGQVILSDTSAGPTPLSPFATVPPLPPSFVERPELTEPIIQKLLSTSRTVALTALEGMGGVGKTVLAVTICRDERIRARFPDGIIWLDIGKEARVTKEDRIKGVADALNQKFSEYSEQAYRTLLAGRSILIVLDDVWTQDAIEPFLIDSGHSRLLYTSREKEFAGPLSAENHEIGILNEREARKFLAIWAGSSEDKLPEPYASGILMECKGLPLALSMIGAVLKGKQAQRWGYVLDDLKRAKLRAIGRKLAGYQYENLHASIAVSVDALEPAQKEKYLQLAILLEDIAIQPVVLQCLWGGDKRSVDDLIDVLVSRSLGSRDADGAMRFHDLQLDYVIGEHPEPRVLDLERNALLRSYHVVRLQPEQFASQMIGRLLAFRSQPGIADLLANLEKHAQRPWLRPLCDSLEHGSGQTLFVIKLSDYCRGLAISDDGKRAITGCKNMLQVWDVDKNYTFRSLEGHADDINAVALSADGKRALSGSHDNTVRLWNLDSSESSRILKAQDGIAFATALRNEGYYLPRSSSEMTSVFKLMLDAGLTGGVRPRILGDHIVIHSVALSANGRLAAYGSVDKAVRVWDLDSQQPPRALKGHTDIIHSVALSADGRFVASGSADKTVRVWDLLSHQLPRLLEGHTDTVYSVALSPDGRFVASGSADKTVRVWDLQDRRSPVVLEAHEFRVCGVAVSPNGERALSCSEDNTICVWDLDSRRPLRVLKGHSGGVLCAVVSSDWNRVISLSDDKTLRVWDLSQPVSESERREIKSWVSSVVVSANGDLAITKAATYKSQIWDLRNQQPQLMRECDLNDVSALTLLPDGKHALLCLYDGTTRIWNPTCEEPPVASLLPNPYFTDGISRELAMSLGPQQRTPYARLIALSNDGNIALCVFDDGAVRVSNLQDHQATHVRQEEIPLVWSVALSANGKRALLGSTDGTLWFWDLEREEPPRRVKGHPRRVDSITLFPDGTRAVTAGEAENTLCIWDFEGVQPSKILEGHTEPVSGVVISDDARYAVSGSEDKTVRIWDLQNSAVVSVFTCDAAVTSVAWAKGKIVAGDRMGQTHFLLWEQ